MVPVTLPVIADRLKMIPVDRLYVRLEVARCVMAQARTDQMRRRALDEIKTVRAELARRQCSVETQW